MEHALEWWNNLKPHRQKYLAQYHEWTTPEQISNNQIFNIYLAEES